MADLEKCRAFVAPGRPSACQRYGECLLIGQVISQSEKGGFAKKDKSEPAGPFWERVLFDQYIERATTSAEKDNCQRLGELRHKIQEIKAQKEIAGQFID